MFDWHASKAQWYGEQANLTLQRGHQTPDPRKAGFEELVSEWLRLAKQAEWIGNPAAARRRRMILIGKPM
jgi:hypothetical protein